MLGETPKTEYVLNHRAFKKSHVMSVTAPKDHNSVSEAYDPGANKVAEGHAPNAQCLRSQRGQGNRRHRDDDRPHEKRFAFERPEVNGHPFHNQPPYPATHHNPKNLRTYNPTTQ